MPIQENNIIFSTPHSKEILNNICKNLNIEKGNAEFIKFSNGEILVKSLVSVRGKNVFIISSPFFKLHSEIFQLLIFLDALKRASAKSITLISPYLPYTRQDRKSKGRQPISAKLLANLLQAAGINRLMTFDLHSPQIQGFYDVPVDDLKSIFLLHDSFKKSVNVKNTKDFVVVSPDFGSLKRAKSFANLLHTKTATIFKSRNEESQIEFTELLGEVENKKCIIIDDIIDTGNTILETLKILKENNVKEAYILGTHGIFTNQCYKKFIKTGIVKKIFITNSITREFDAQYKKFIEIVPLDHFLCDILNNIINNKSISRIYPDK